MQYVGPTFPTWRQVNSCHLLANNCTAGLVSDLSVQRRESMTTLKCKSQLLHCSLVLLFFCQSVSLSYSIEETRLIFFSKQLRSDNIVLRTLMCVMIKYEMLGLAAEYGLSDVSLLLGIQTVWSVMQCFVQKSSVVMFFTICLGLVSFHCIVCSLYVSAYCTLCVVNK